MNETKMITATAAATTAAIVGTTTAASTNDFKLLRNYVSRYFKGKSYSINITVDRKTRDAVIDKSLIQVEYDADLEVLDLIYNENKKQRIEIDLINGDITGSISIYWDSKIGNCNPFLPLGDQIYNKDLIKKLLNYSTLSMEGRYVPPEKSYDHIGGYCLYIADKINGYKDISNMKIYTMFKNPSEFITDVNIKKNLVVDSKEKFIWLFRALDSLVDICNNEDIPLYDIEVRDIAITDGMINKIFEVKSTGNKSVAIATAGADAAKCATSSICNIREIAAINSILFKNCNIETSKDIKYLFQSGTIIEYDSYD